MYNFSFLFFFLSFETTSHHDMQLGARRRRMETERRDAFYLSRACARWFATAILVSFDSPCGLSVWVSVIEMCDVVANGCVCVYVYMYVSLVRLSFTGVMHNLSSLAVFARGSTLFDIIQYHDRIVQQIIPHFVLIREIVSIR